MQGNPIEEKLFGRIPIKHGWAFLKFKKRGTVQHLLHQLKYNNHPEIGIALGKVFGKTLSDSGFDQSFELIVPVPLHRSRLLKRGYNQSSKFAEGLSSSLKIPWDESISIRRDKTTTQTKKTRMQRWENVKDVFTVSQNTTISGKRILLVDDVITTGATSRSLRPALDCGWLCAIKHCRYCGGTIKKPPDISGGFIFLFVRLINN